MVCPSGEVDPLRNDHRIFNARAGDEVVKSGAGEGRGGVNCAHACCFVGINLTQRERGTVKKTAVFA